MRVKGYLFGCVLVILGPDIVRAQGPDPDRPEYVEGTILVKLTDTAPLRKPIAIQKGQVVTGISQIDELNRQYRVKEMEQLFPNWRAPSGKPIKRTMRDIHGREYEVPRLDRIYRLRYEDPIDAQEFARVYSESEYVEYAEPDYYFYALREVSGADVSRLGKRVGTSRTTATPDDPLYSEQWYLPEVRAPEAWDITTGDTTQVIGIIDTGVDWTHPDLDDNIWRNRDEIPDNGADDDGNGYVDDVRGWDFINDDNDPRDDNSHGTHVAGIAAAEGNNGVGICGVAWNARIMPVKVLQSSGKGTSSDIAAGINYATHNGATVINMSLGNYAESQTVKAALEDAYAYAVLVAAAGNDGYKVDPPPPPWPSYKPMYPACYSFVLGVGATGSTSNFDPSGPIVAKNIYGHNYEIRAPGNSIYSIFPNGNYHYLNGTSMASSIVAGAVALMRNYNPNQSMEQIFARLIQGANNGVLDIGNSVDYELEPDLYYVECTLIDTLSGCDDDGIADVGETVELYLTVKMPVAWRIVSG